MSLVVVVPAVSGPYDFGNVAVRVAVYVNPATASLTAVSDPLPRIVSGVPLRLRSVQVNLDRPAFVLNPTNCDPFSVGATLTGDQGAVSSFAAPFQVANCTDLPYAPKLSLNLSGGVNRRGHPAITAVFKTKRRGSQHPTCLGCAAAGRAARQLPHRHGLHAPRVCQRHLPRLEQHRNSGSNDAAARSAAEGQCVPALLEQRAARPGRRPRGPDRHRAGGDASARSKKGALRTTFEAVPDAPVTSVVLKLQGGSKGLLQNSESLCGAPKKASVKMTGQNGRTTESKVPLRATCGAKARHKRHHGPHKRRIAGAGGVR